MSTPAAPLAVVILAAWVAAVNTLPWDMAAHAAAALEAPAAADAAEPPPPPPPPPPTSPQPPATDVVEHASSVPCRRPRLWAHPRTLESASWSFALDTPTNATLLTIRHAPIKGVTVAMMQWLFRNMDAPVADPRTAETYPAFVLLHPVDNVEFSYSTPRQMRINASHPSAGTAWRFAHFYAAGCSSSNSGGRPSVTCPPSRAAPGCSSPDAALRAASSHVEHHYYATRLDGAGFGAVTTAGGSGGPPLARVTYAWHDSPEGLHISQEVVMGVVDVGAGAPWAPRLNDLIRRQLARATGGDVRVALAQMALHEVEIVGFYPQWLPQAYRASEAGA